MSGSFAFLFLAFVATPAYFLPALKHGVAMVSDRGKKASI
jgi:hypothetical protein